MSHLPASRSARPASLVLAGIAVAAVAVVAIAAGPLRPGGSASPPPAASPTVAPSSAPDPTPVPTPLPTPTASPVPAPSGDPGTGRPPASVALDTFDRHHVTVRIVDETGTLVGAVSGHPGDNPSADGLVAANLDARTIRLTWVDFPIDNALTLFVTEVDGHLRLLLIQPAPTAPTDAIGMDRQLVLTFDHPIDAGSIEGIIQEGQDT